MTNETFTHAVAASSDAPDFQSGEGGSQPTLLLHSSSGPIYEDQTTLFGRPRVVGGFRGDLAVREIRRDLANRLIVQHHYSHKFYSASTIHLGVYWRDELVGVLQYGYAMNPASAGSVVTGTEMDEYLELNRMWVTDAMPRNTESAAISLSLQYVKSAWPKVAWVQSFADERCRRLGVVYQACSFIYCGEHTTTFYELDGVVYHKSLAERDPSLSKSAALLQRNLDRAVASDYRQFRYVKFLKRGWEKRLRLPQLPYPKAAA